jgi:thiol-disulfide isomerase/thioredoxin
MEAASSSMPAFGVVVRTLRFELIQGSDDNGVALRIDSSTYRSGKILLSGREIPFRLSGDQGRYGIPGTYVFFDREGNGKYESYRSTDRWVNLAGKTYEFHVDPQGASLTLKESESRPDRPSLKNGSPIPDVSLTDLEGKAHAFRHNTADFTLLEFWNTNCAPCRIEMPKLKALYDKLPRSRFDILGVSGDESEEVLKKYLAKFAIPWPECREPDQGPVHRLMRIEDIPVYFLLSKNGEILDHWVGSGSTISKIEAALK